MPSPTAGRISRLLTTLLLLKNGIRVGRYVPHEDKIEQNKDAYYGSLQEAQDGWLEGCENPVSFIKYLLGTILAASRDFESCLTTESPF